MVIGVPLSNSDESWVVLVPGGLVGVLRLDLTGSGRTEGGRKDESGGQLLTVLTRTRAGESEFKNRGDKRRPEPSRRIRAFRRTSDRDEGEVSNISSGVIEYKYTKYIY